MTESIMRITDALRTADCVLIGAGAGLSTSAGYDYAGTRFMTYFADFHERFGTTDIYGGGFYPFPSGEIFWAWWSRSIYVNRYAPMPESDVYPNLLRLIREKDYFVLTTNVDHAFQRTGFDKERLFYTQGDFGLFQSSRPAGASAGRTYDNEEQVRAMLRAQGFTFAPNGALLLPEYGAPLMEVPAHLIPYCPDDGTEMTTNLRVDASFVEDAGWHAAAARYEDWLAHSERRRMLLLELGVGANTPGIIKYPFWLMTAERADVTLVTVSRDAYVPKEIRDRSVVLGSDIGVVLRELV